MDELALLREFRIEDAMSAGARAHARRALNSRIVRQRRQRRLVLAAAIVLGGALIVGAAYGVVRELGVGDPAPTEVQLQPARFGHSAELIPVPHPEQPQLQHAKVAAILDSSVGRVYLFSSPSATGICGSWWIEGDRGYQGRLNISGGCGTTKQSFYAFSTTPYKGKTVYFASGRVVDGVARVSVGTDGRLVNVPLVGRWFLAELPEHANEFRSYDRAGHLLESKTFHRVFGRGQRPPHQVTRMKEVVGIRARAGERVTLLVARASNGGYCQSVRSDRRPSNFGCGMPRPRPRELGINAMNFGGAPGGILLLVGPVGRSIATVELRYQDGRVMRIPLTDQWALYEVAVRDYAQGRRPQLLVGLDTNDRKVASVRLPYTTKPS